MREPEVDMAEIRLFEADETDQSAPLDTHASLINRLAADGAEISPMTGPMPTAIQSDHAHLTPLLWTDEQEFAPGWFLVELAGMDQQLFESDGELFFFAVKPALRLLRTPALHQITVPGGGIQCLVNSHDAQLVVRITPDLGTIEVRCLNDTAAAIRFCECVAAGTEATSWRVRDMASDAAPPQLASPPYAMLFGRVIAERRSAVQHIVLSKHPVCGNILVLGGEIQIGARDVEDYSRALVDPGVTTSTRRVLILGGGDCGVLKAVLRHPVERVVMVELDPEVVSFCQTHMPSAMDNALCDPRAEIRYEDAFTYIRDCIERFDLVVWDLPDVPIGGVSISERVATLAKLLSEGGRLVAHSDCWDPEGSNDDVPTVEALNRQFAQVELQRRTLPCFQDYPWLFLCARNPIGEAS